ncbi:hypothetical protein [Brevundimonas alba]|nr:hypothetical protein [Brevundimonas alba]
MKEVALLLAVGAVPWLSPPNATPVTTAEEACAAVKAHVVSRNSRAASVIAFCDHIPETESPRGYYVMALHSNRECEGICSTNMGWFAVQKSTGDVLDWDVAEWRPG